MSPHLTPEQIEDLALSGETSPHLAACEACARELRWAQAELGLFARRPEKLVAHLWADVARRTAPAKVLPLRRRRFAAVAAAAMAAAAALLLVVQRPHRPGSPLGMPDAAVPEEAQDDAPPVDVKALAALDRAEGEVRQAASVLEAEYQAARPRLDPKEARKWDATLEKARANLGTAGMVAQLDVQARLRMLDGYSGYLRSLREVVASSGSQE